MDIQAMQTQALQWSQRMRMHLRQEQAQGQVSPTDAAFLMRLVTFLEGLAQPGLPAPAQEDLQAKAQEVRRYLRQEQAQGQISPTDAALLTRLASFLEAEVATALLSGQQDGAAKEG